MLKSKRLFVFIFFAGAGVFLFFLSGFFSEKIIINLVFAPPLEEPSEDHKQEEIIFIAVGDIMLNRGVAYMVEEYGGGDYGFPFALIKDKLVSADIVFGNLESVISDKGSDVGGPYSFRADPRAVEGLKQSGFDALSVANNHVFDWGRPAMEDSFKRLKKAGIIYVGGGFDEAEATSPKIIEVKATKIGFLGYTNVGAEFWQAKGDRSGIGWLDERIEADISRAKEETDLLFVSFHFGQEYQKEPSYQQKYWARLAVEAGADLVIGHHPHVTQTLEKYQESFIVYSLGNFVFDQGFSEETMKGWLLEATIKNKQVQEVKTREVVLNRFFQPALESTP